ncbi:MAG: alpha/beta hydrolase fold domain-containing protein [Candidatus Promineifilaceae bacterium]|nr:alpha/beta hydrolase fold domain-containing protein [Candidatus Promineifilaceae bacterium]
MQLAKSSLDNTSRVFYVRFCRQFTLASGLRALGIDDRLAPEHRYPAALEGATAVYRSLAHYPVCLSDGCRIRTGAFTRLRIDKENID